MLAPHDHLDIQSACCTVIGCEITSDDDHVAHLGSLCLLCCCSRNERLSDQARQGSLVIRRSLQWAELAVSEGSCTAVAGDLPSDGCMGATSDAVVVLGLLGPCVCKAGACMLV